MLLFAGKSRTKSKEGQENSTPKIKILHFFLLFFSLIFLLEIIKTIQKPNLQLKIISLPQCKYCKNSDKEDSNESCSNLPLYDINSIDQPMSSTSFDNSRGMNVADWMNMELAKANQNYNAASAHINEVGEVGAGSTVGDYASYLGDIGIEDLEMAAAFGIQRDNIDLNLSPLEKMLEF